MTIKTAWIGYSLIPEKVIPNAENVEMSLLMRIIGLR